MAAARGSYDTQTTPSRILPDLYKVGRASSSLCSGGFYGPRPGSSRQLRNLPPTPWQLLGLRGNPGIYMAVTGLLDCCHVPPVTASHAHRRMQAGRWAEPARVSAECQQGVGRASTDLLIINRNSDSAHPYVE